MSSISCRNGVWQAKVRRRGMPAVSRTFDLKRDAEAWAREIEREIQRGNLAVLRQEAQRITVAELLDSYEAGPLRLLRSAKDAAVRLRRARERFGPLYLANVRAIDIGRWRDELLGLGLSPQTVIHHLAALSAAFGYAEKDLGIDLPSGNPCKAVRKPRMPKARDRRLREGELDALLEAAAQSKAEGLAQIITLAVETSMRLGELLRLDWRHIDLKRRTAHLPETKNGESRTVALSSAAVAALQALPRRLDGRVFGWKAASSFEHAWWRCVARARAAYEAQCEAQGTAPDPAFLSDLRFHDLRHEAASRLFEKGLGVMEVSQMTGHKSLVMLKRYTNVDAERLAKKLG